MRGRRRFPIHPGAMALTLAVTACTSSTPSDPGPSGTGHSVHLRGDTLYAPSTCAGCHAPTGFTVDFSQDPLVRAHGGTFDLVTQTCSSVYCHGAFTFGAISGSHASPTWSDPVPLACTSCHGMPPTGHPALSGTVTAATCNPCHPQTVDAQGKIVLASGAHIDGKAQSAAVGCVGCHGDAARTPNLPGTDVNLASSPPAAPSSAPASATGAHLGHVNPTAASSLMPPIACAECHPVPSDSVHATSPPPQSVVFGPSSATGGAAPAWNPVTAGCSASYCHGSFAFGAVQGAGATPTWTDASPLTCISCHAMPPTGHPAYPGAQDAPSCFQCHPQSVSADGTVKAGGGHLNGKPDGGGCTSCHGDPPATGRHMQEDHARDRCDVCHPVGYTSSTAVASFHQNGVTDLGAQAGYSCGLQGCPTGGVGTCTNSCHTEVQRW